MPDSDQRRFGYRIVRGICISLLVFCMPSPFAASTGTYIGSVEDYITAQQSTDASAQPLLTFNFMVRDSQGRPVRDLAKSQVHVFLGSEEQTIESLEGVSAHAMSLVFLDDQTGSRRGTFGMDQKHYIYPEIPPIDRLLHAFIAYGNMAMVAGFNDDVAAPGGFTEDAAELTKQIHQLAEYAPRGGTALYDGMAWACEKLSSRQGFRAAIVVSDGVDNMSRLNMERTVAAAQEAGVSLYLISFVRARRDADSHSKTLSDKRYFEIARQVGGDTIGVTTAAEMDAAFDRIGEDMGNTYALRFRPRGSPENKVTHGVKVTVDGDRLTVIAPTGNYAISR